MEMKTNNISREERRKKIIGRELDRMELITDSVPNLDIPPNPPPSPAPSSTSYQYHINAGLEPHKITKEVSNEEKDSSVGSQVEQQILEKCKERLDHAIQSHVENDSNKILHTRQKPKLFSSKRLNSCIIASETTRIFCALIIAFLVVLSYVDYPLFGRNIVRSESVVASRPLYILLLTDVTIVFAQLYLENRGGGLEEEEEEEEVMPQVQDDLGHNWTQAVKLLERGLVVYQAIRGIFIDCSVYAVVVICGLSLV